MTALLFVIASGLGAATRLAVNQLGWSWRGTATVNVAGSFALGWLLAGGPSEGAIVVLGTGFLGSLTTFSMFAVEASAGRRSERVAVVATNVIGGMIGAWFGLGLG